MINKSRERMIKAFEYDNPDKIPVVYHQSEAGLYVHGQKLLDLFNEYPPDNPIKFDSIPRPKKETVNENGEYHELKRDDWGITWEYRIFGIQGHPFEYPFSSWQNAEKYQLPKIPKIGSEQFYKDKKYFSEQNKNYLTIGGWFSLFMQLYGLYPMEEVLMDLFTEDKYLIKFLDRLTEFRIEEIKYFIEAGLDVFMLADDLFSQDAQLISTELFNKLFKPRYEAMLAPIKDAKKKVFFHICGSGDTIIDELFNLKIDGLWPQINCYDLSSFSKRCKDEKVTIYIHPDRQRLIPKGSPQEIEDQIKKYSEVYHNLGGGGIFYVEIENDAPWENIETLIQSIHKYR